MERDYQAASLRVARTEHVVDVLDNGHTIQVTYDEGSTITLRAIIHDNNRPVQPRHERRLVINIANE